MATKTVTFPVDLGGSGATYRNDAGTNGMAASNGYAYKDTLFDMLDESIDVANGVKTNADSAAVDAAQASVDAAQASVDAASAATSRAAIDNRIYPGTYASAPTTRPDGSAIQNGDEYFNSTSNARYTRSGGVWVLTTAASSADLANTSDGAKGSALVGHLPAGTGAMGRTVQGKLRETVSVSDFGAVGDGSTNDSTAVGNAIAALMAPGQVVLPSGDYLVSAAPSNDLGVELVGPGRLLKAITGGYQQLSSYADRFQHVTGVEYMAAFHRRIIDNSLGCNVVLTGDSTTAGDGVTGDWVPSALVKKLAWARGVYRQFTYNRGQSGKHSGDWVSTYVAGDITNGGNTPHLIVVRWGINDPYFGRTLSQYITSMKAGLAAIRASLTVSQCAILLMAPSSTSDTPGSRDERWYERVTPALRKMARDYQCAFFDTYAWCKDSRGAAGIWMDNPYGDGRAIHPLDVMNAAIYTRVADIIYPSGLAPVATNRFQNLSSNDVAAKAASDVPSTYDKGITMHRASPADGWPLDGAVATIRPVDGTFCMQMHWSYNDALGEVRVRVGQGTTWYAWTSISEPVAQTLTLQNSWVAYAGTYAIKAKKQGNLIRLTGLIKDGVTTTGTVIATLPAGYRPSQNVWFSVMTDTNGQIARVYVTPVGAVTIHYSPSSGFLSLDDIAFYV